MAHLKNKFFFQTNKNLSFSARNIWKTSLLQCSTAFPGSPVSIACFILLLLCSPGLRNRRHVSGGDGQRAGGRTPLIQVQSRGFGATLERKGERGTLSVPKCKHFRGLVSKALRLQNFCKSRYMAAYPGPPFVISLPKKASLWVSEGFLDFFWCNFSSPLQLSL